MLKHLNAQQNGSFKDSRDGKIYKTVKIGSQVWMAENLNVSRFRNGDLIPEAKTNEEWLNAGENKKPVWCYYQNIEENGIKYGKLYNYHAIVDPRGLAPYGWRISKKEDFDTLKYFLEKKGFKYDITSEKDINLQLKSKNEWDEITYIHHVAEVPSAVNKITNSTGWSANPGGARANYGFMGIGSLAFWYLTNAEYPFQIGDYDGDIGVPNAGCSVRCVKDGTMKNLPQNTLKEIETVNCPNDFNEISIKNISGTARKYKAQDGHYYYQVKINVKSGPITSKYLTKITVQRTQKSENVPIGSIFRSFYINGSSGTFTFDGSFETDFFEIEGTYSCVTGRFGGPSAKIYFRDLKIIP